MNTNKFSREDRYMQLIWVTAKVVAENRALLRDAQHLPDTLRHRDQVTQLINDISYTLNKFHLWASGFNIAQDLITIRHRLECYKDRIYGGMRQFPELTIQQYNIEKATFAAIIRDFQNLFE